MAPKQFLVDEKSGSILVSLHVVQVAKNRKIKSETSQALWVHRKWLKFVQKAHTLESDFCGAPCAFETLPSLHFFKSLSTVVDALRQDLLL